MAQTQLRSGFSQIHIIEEGTTGAHQAPADNGTGMFMVHVDGISYDSPNFEPVYDRADSFSMDEIPGPCSATISFSFPLKHAGSAVAPKTDPFWKACGMAITTTTYNPTSTFDSAGGNPHYSYSCSILQDGIRYAVRGAFGDFSIAANAGEPAMVSGTMTGAYETIATDATEAAVYDPSIAPAFMGASMAIDGGATRVGMKAFDFALGNKIQIGKDANHASGIYGARITGRKSSGSVTVETDLTRTVADAVTWRAGTAGAFTTGAIGPSANNRWTLTCARVVKRAPEFSDNDGIGNVKWGFGVGSLPTDVEGTNDDVSLIFA